MSTHTQPTKQTLIGLDLVRAVAAALVMFVHYDKFFLHHFGYSPFQSVSHFGGIGVDYFFLLSGFLMYYLHQRDWGNRSAAPAYAVKRFARIYPMYWVSLLMTLGLSLFISSPIYPVGVDWLYNLFLVTPNDPSSRILGVSWTLTHEIVYYMMFGLTLFLPRAIGAPLLVAWAVLIGVGSYMGVTGSVLLSPYSLLFLSGCLVAQLLPVAGRLALPKLCLVAMVLVGFGLTLFVEYLYHTIGLSQFYEKALFAMGGATGLLGLILLESWHSFTWPGSRLIKAGARSSYTLYLLHIFWGMITFKVILITPLHSVLPHHVLMVGMMLVAWVLSHTVSNLLEYRLTSATQSLLMFRKLQFMRAA